MTFKARSGLFALVLPLAACGGDRDVATVDFDPMHDVVRMPNVDRVGQPIDVSSPFAATPTPIDAAKPLPTKYDELLVIGKQLVDQGKHADAKPMFEAASKLERKKAEPHIELARMYIATKQKGPAVAAANKAVKLAPASSQAWNTKGRAELAAHKYDEAASAFTKAVELNPDNVYAWNNLGYTELLRKNYENAVTHLTEATQRRGATGYMFNNLGAALEHLDRLDDARLAYESGGALGSKEAAASRKRLEGVESIFVVATAEPDIDDHEDLKVVPKVQEYSTIEETEDLGPAAVEKADEEGELEAGDNATM